MMPQATEQYVHVLRVSVVAVSLNGRTEAARASPAEPKPRAPTLDAASPAAVSFMKLRRFRSIATRSPNSSYQTAMRRTTKPARSGPSPCAGHPSPVASHLLSAPSQPVRCPARRRLSERLGEVHPLFGRCFVSIPH